MQALTRAVNELYFKIPKMILETVYLYGENSWLSEPISLDERILSTIIRPRVLVDCNLIGGVEIKVPLSNLRPRVYNNGDAVYRIPKSLLDGRSIVSVLSVTNENFYHEYSRGMYLHTTSDVGAAALRVGDSHSRMSPAHTTRVELIGENVILVKYVDTYFRYVTARVVVTNDENMSNLNPRHYIHFSKLCLLAVKSDIYNRMILNMDVGYMINGHELGAMKEKIMEYADAEEMYEEYLLTTWSKISFMNDESRHRNFIKAQINPGV